VRRAHGVILSSLLVVAAVSGCNSTTEPEATSTGAAPVATTAAPPEPSSAAPTPAEMDAATKQACTKLLKAVKDTAKQVADSEKIGPPAGHIAVSAAYIAGATEITAYSIGVNEPVGTAAGKVEAAMSDLDKKWNENPKKDPSKAELKAAVKELETACAAS
jgi:hypothetical protein